ncbi:MAG: heme ABC exporter ATP-binding protein CcmA [Devosia sp.]
MSLTAPPPNALPPQHLEVSGLGLSRGGRTLFEGLDLRLGHWETLLLSGPNGAGKSSLLLALAGVLRPDAGTLRWPGGERPLLHLLGHESAVKPRLTLAENLGFWRSVNGPTGMTPGAALEAVGLGGLDRIEAGHLSAGQTRRLGLGRLLVSRRDIWLLDEPTASLDAGGVTLVAGLLAAHAATGGGAIVATHDELALTTPATTLRLGLP